MVEISTSVRDVVFVTAERPHETEMHTFLVSADTRTQTLRMGVHGTQYRARAISEETVSCLPTRVEHRGVGLPHRRAERRGYKSHLTSAAVGHAANISSGLDIAVSRFPCLLFACGRKLWRAVACSHQADDPHRSSMVQFFSHWILLWCMRFV